MFCLALTLLSATLLAADYKVYEITETKEGFAGLYVVLTELLYDFIIAENLYL